MTNALGNVLVVDDEPDWCKKIKAILEEDGFSVQTVGGHEEALQVLLQQPMHVTVLDLKLADEDLLKAKGFRILREIRELGLNEMIYSVVLTGYASLAREAFAEYGVIDFFEKSKLSSEIDRFRQAVRKATLKAKYAQLSKCGFKCFKTGGNCSHTILEELGYIFVAMPYRESQNTLYMYGLKPLETRLKCEVERADEAKLNIDLMCKVCQLIQKARICIVDITGWSANVLFELGLMYGWGKDVILIKHAQDEVEKADLKGMEYEPYELDKLDALRGALAQMLVDKGIRPK
jgi:ActR/RegA family two-component response regulator